MRYRRSYRSNRRKPRYIWARGNTNNASANASLNSIDLLSAFRSHAGISINLPAFTIWRVRIRITVVITLAAAMASNDGVLVTGFIDSYDQTPNNQLSNTYDQQYTTFDMLAAADSGEFAHATAAGTYILTKEYDLKAHRKLQALDDTYWIQLASSGQAVQTNYTLTYAVLFREKV